MADSKISTLAATSYAGVNLKKDRHGGIAYAYHRKTKTRLRSPVGTPEFDAELTKLNGLIEQRNDPLYGSLAGLFDDYRESADFKNLSPRTKGDYEKIFRYLRPGAEKKLLLSFRARDALTIRDATAAKHKQHFANYCMSVLRSVLNWAKTYDYIETNPLAGLHRLKLKRPHGMPKANRRWAPFECDEVLEAASGGVKVALALGMFAGMREGDALRVTRLNYDGHRLTWVQGKTGDPVRLPVAQRLKVILDEALAARPHDCVEHLQLVLNQRGRPYKPNGFRTMLWRLIHGLEVEGKVMAGLTFHGLRHTAATTLAELGANQHEIAALLGHRSLVMAALYSAEADREKLGEAAIIRLNPRHREP
jgi:integrase